MIGEKLTGTMSSPALTTNQWNDPGTITLTPGVWLAFGMLKISGGGTTQSAMNVGISSTSGNSEPIGYVSGEITTTAATNRFLNAMPRYFNVSVNTSIYLKCVSTFTGTASSVNSAESTFHAVRIA